MSITLKIVDFVDHLKIQNFFMEQNNKILFAPIRIELNEKYIEKQLNKLFSGNGNPYQMNEFEKACLKELDF